MFLFYERYMVYIGCVFYREDILMHTCNVSNNW